MQMIKRRFAIVLLFAMFSATLSPIVHMKVQHIHDASCSVYVLEHLFVASDVATAQPISLLFIAFIYEAWIEHHVSNKPVRSTQVRAPPSFHF